MINVCPAISTFLAVVIILTAAVCSRKVTIVNQPVIDLFIDDIEDLNFISSIRATVENLIPENTSKRLNVSKLRQVSVMVDEATLFTDISVAKSEFYT